MDDETAKEPGMPELPRSDSENESNGEKGKNGQKSLRNYEEILNEAKQDSRLIKSRLLKREDK